VCPDATSQLQTPRRDYFYGNLSSIIALCGSADLERSLFRPWDYADPLANRSLHIDPAEDRRYAYQWHQPTSDPTRSKQGGMVGANRLAVEAIPFFQSIAAGDKLITRGFSGTRVNQVVWTWPMWARPLGPREVGSLLSLSDLQAKEPDASALMARGIAGAFRCRRILVEQTPNFTPATAVF
jgi:CRISPR-associated endonuclease/helicase Cas3